MKEVPVGKSHVALVDDEDYERVAAYRWSYAAGYALNSKVGSMHRFIMGHPSGLDVHHKSRSKLDNRKGMLEVLTHKAHFQQHGAEDWRGPRKRKRYAVTIRFYSDDLAALRQLAEREQRPLNGQIQLLIQEHLAELRKNETIER